MRSWKMLLLLAIPPSLRGSPCASMEDAALANFFGLPVQPWKMLLLLILAIPAVRWRKSPCGRGRCCAG